MSPRNNRKYLLALLLFPACTAETTELVDENAASLVGPCIRHAQCASHVCDVYQDTDRGPGRCIPEEEVHYVGREGADVETCERATGVRRDPFCQIRDAVSALGNKKVIRAEPGFYLPFHIGSRAEVTLHGPAGEGGIAQVTEEDTGGSSVRGGANVVLDGLEIGKYSYGAGLRCEGAGTRLFVRRSQILTDTGTGLRTKDCDLRLDRTLLSGLRGAAELVNTKYRVENTVVTGVSEATAIRVSGGSGSFRFVTVFGNMQEQAIPGAFDCGRTSVVLEDSIVFGNRLGPSGSQLAGACRLSRVVVGRTDGFVSSGAIRKDPVLKGHVLPRNETNLGCCIDKAKADPQIWTDYNGSPRPRGRGYDIGAYEAR